MSNEARILLVDDDPTVLLTLEAVFRDAGYDVVSAPWDPMYIVDHYPRTMFTAVGVRECFEWDPRLFKHVDPSMPTFGAPHVTQSDAGIVGSSPCKLTTILSSGQSIRSQTSAMRSVPLR